MEVLRLTGDILSDDRPLDELFSSIAGTKACRRDSAAAPICGRLEKSNKISFGILEE